MTIPIISWYEKTNKKSDEVVDVVNYGTVDADSESEEKVFFVWNNRDGDEDVSKMEEVIFTTRDRLGGTGDTPGAIVESVRDNWFNVRVDSLDEGSFTAVGKGGGSSGNPDGTKAIGTNKSTTNPNAATASTWATGLEYGLGEYIKPTVGNEYIYRVTEAGTTSGSEPSWTTTENNTVVDGTVEYIAVKIKKIPAAGEILGLANNVNVDGSDAEANGGGNYAKLTVFAEVPITASAGRNLLMQRVSYRYV